MTIDIIAFVHDMMADFTGMTISVTLQQPPGAILIGRVVHVVAGEYLALEQVFFPQSGNHVPSYNVPAQLIQDLRVVETNFEASSKPHTPSANFSASRAPAQFPAPLPAQEARTESPLAKKTPSFVDPAILSFSKSPAPTARSQPPPLPQQPSAPVTPSKKALSAAAAAIPPTNTSRFVAHAAEPSAHQDQDYVDDNTGQSGKKTRRGRRGPRTTQVPVTAATEAQTVKETLSPNVSRNGNDMTITPSTNKKGWRSTPLLKEPTSAASSKTKKKAKRPLNGLGDQNGWATEEATDIQDMGDFDFEANLSKFDKRTVFDQIRNEDTTADEDRLVSHNRLARPGTYGGKNLHPTENVLSPTLKPKHHGSELESSSDADTEVNFGSGPNSRRAPSRTSNKRPSRMSTSGLPEDIIHPLAASLASTALNRSVSSLRDSSVVASSPNPNRARSPQSIQSPMHSLDQLSLAQQAAAVPRPHFKTPKSKYPCSLYHPDRLRQAEADAISNIGISADAITENAARGTAESVLTSTLKPGASRRNSKIANNLPNSNSKSVVVILAGNHITGARAIASARHLYSRGFKVLISVLDFSNPSVWHPQLAKHIHSLQALGRKAARIEGWRSTSGQIKKLEGPPVIIVDALLDGQRYADIRDEDLRTEAREMIDWANRSRAGVVSINIPSGFDNVDGSSSIVDGEPLAIRPEAVLALGVPVLGLLEAIKEGEGSAWVITAIDTGVNVVLSDREKVQFGADWSVNLRFVSGETQA
ncbi:YjeF N-terminal domain-like protein [Aureobasidium subglaciale]|nr:YjeF N-terminal domain-like protein [Aureobasidium subglaciale]